MVITNFLVMDGCLPECLVDFGNGLNLSIVYYMWVETEDNSDDVSVFNLALINIKYLKLKYN